MVTRNARTKRTTSHMQQRAAVHSLLGMAVMWLLMIPHKAAGHLEVQLSAPEVSTTEAFSVSCVLNDSRVESLPWIHIGGTWTRDGYQNLREDKDVIHAQDSYIEILHSSQVSPEPQYETVGAFSMKNTSQGYWSRRLSLHITAFIIQSRLDGYDGRYSITNDDGVFRATLTTTLTYYEFSGVYLCRARLDGEMLVSDPENFTVTGAPNIRQVSSSPRDIILGFPVVLTCSFSTYPRPSAVVWTHEEDNHILHGKQIM
ncbi:hypothetical protein ElyMa_000910600 [Elysia marginata]|uniref:Ig-like domain-containing protein n=1 Tax=Elysia marginata TaxID=1093978 RepID=A0AAV4H787_9GAST|nr:hypothetical protein ElyMa_000910600 [Elysia marginata]